ncbi:MAG: peroxisomal targeting signal 2 receptor [Cirrosporium novae-zelandiae]|nr:MAG: peroxisomal targeting signal 2 receptor [Cirrosporium novae-zelandiae]
MLEFRTTGFNGYSVKYSPFYDSRIAVAASANFGLVGNGRVYPTQDSQYDITWSELHEDQAAIACGDGSIKIFDTNVDEFPVRSWQEHKREVFSVCWNLVDKDTLCSSSWDGTVKIWRPDVPTSLLTLPTHSCTYSALFSPHHPNLVTSVSSDSLLRLFDLRAPPSPSGDRLALTIPISNPPSEALTHDWNKYRDNIIATAGVDRAIRVFDIRAAGHGPISELTGHEYAVRRVTWSPHLSDVLLSASYDMTCRVWSDGSTITGNIPPTITGGGMGTAKEMGRMSRHTEFVTGVDWCLFGAEGWCASCGWDERLAVWDVRAIMAAGSG